MARRFCLLALGSRGDVQPFVGLGRGLRARGYEVVIAAAEDYQSLADEHGLEFVPLVGRIADLMDKEAVAASLDGGPLGSLRLALRMRSDISTLMDTLFRDVYEAARGSDVLIVSTLGQYVGFSVGDALGIPVIATHVHPYAPSKYYAHMFFPPAFFPWGRAVYNRVTHTLGIHGLWHLLRPALNKARQRVLGLAPQSLIGLEKLIHVQKQSGLQLYAYSPTLAPPPPDWNPYRHVVTGYWNSLRPDHWRPPRELSAFLQAGPPPVYVGFGSILAGRNPDAITRLLVDALQQVKMRGILYRGWGDIGNIALPSTVFAIDSTPHDWLFPQCAAIVHHGGAGTTMAALRAQIPAIVVPVFGDQRFWADCLYRAGASPTPIPRSRLSVPKLTEAITAAVSEKRFAEQTRSLACAVNSEDGVTKAIETLETWTR